jgi:gliding motility-associated-like protein
MFKRSIYIFIYITTVLFAKAQNNLVPNPSFEDTLKCFGGMGVSNPTTSNKYLTEWYATKYLTADYFNTCANFFPGNPYPVASTVPLHCYGYQMPHVGNAYVGIALYSDLNIPDSAHVYKEYVSVKLKSQLKPNVCYYGEFYVNLAEVSGLACNQISMYLTQNTFTTSLNSFTNSIQPQIQWDTTQFFTDTLNWIKISGYFTAQGGEEHLTIGNFKDGLITKKQSTGSNWVSPPNCGSQPAYLGGSYIHVDDVALYEIPSPLLSFNTITICPDADSILIGDTAKIKTSYQWFTNGSLIANTSSITVKPSQTTSYVLQTTQCNTTTQTVVVTYSANCEPVVVVEPIIPNVFTPNNDSINDVWRFTLGKGNTLKVLSIYNRWGNDVTPSFYQQENLKATTVLWDGRTTAGEQTPSGVYFYILQYIDANGVEHKKNGYITLIR